MIKDENNHSEPDKLPINADDWGMLDLNMTNNELVKNLTERLDSVFAKYGCDPDEIGWRELSLYLLLKYEPAFRLKRSDDMMTPNLSELLTIAKLERRGYTVRDAARLVAAETGKKAKSLEARFSESKNKKLDKGNRGRVFLALEAAADELQNSDRISTNYIKQICENLRLPPRIQIVVIDEE